VGSSQLFAFEWTDICHGCAQANSELRRRQHRREAAETASHARTRSRAAPAAECAVSGHGRSRLPRVSGGSRCRRIAARANNRRCGPAPRRPDVKHGSVNNRGPDGDRANAIARGEEPPHAAMSRS
jgi:hypothetical protein